MCYAWPYCWSCMTYVVLPYATYQANASVSPGLRDWRLFPWSSPNRRVFPVQEIGLSNRLLHTIQS